MSNSPSLDKLIKLNEYPIIFIGSGISKRYLNKYPKWIELLKEFWDIINPNEDFFALVNKTKKNLKEKYDNDLDYSTYIELGSIIEERFNDKFYNSEIEITNFSQEEAFYTDISPFKKALSNRFMNYELNETMEEEFNLFKKTLNHSQIILTTNYDTLIEDSFSNDNKKRQLKKFIGQNGFFKQTEGWGEIFKIHGCVTNPKSIVISKNDYSNFNQNSVLISAKIISLLINSPIIFLGYSLTDRNIRKIIKDFSSSLSDSEKGQLQDRIIIVNRKEGENNLIEYKKSDDELECTYTVIETDNFGTIYKELLKINQGAFPSEVRKFQGLIKELIIDRGKKGNLKSLLISPLDLDELGDRISDENLVVALGDTTYIFKLPDIITFMEDFLNNSEEIYTDIALKFIAIQTPNARIPIFKYLHNVDLDQTSLNPAEKEKIRQRIDRFGDLEDNINKINRSHKQAFNSIDAILDKKYREEKEIDIISYNIENFYLEEVKLYLMKKLEKYKELDTISLNSAYRRLAVLYDIKKYKSD